MKRIPPEIENLIWAIAESNEPNAVLEFEQRYPDYTMALHQRIKTVNALKAGKKSPISAAPPRFSPRETAAPSQPVALYVAACLLVLSAIGLAGFALTRPKTNDAAGLTANEKLNLEEPKLPGTDGVVRGNPMIDYPNGATQNEAPPVVNPAPVPPQNPATTGGDIPKYLVKTNLKLQRAPLMVALQLIAETGGLGVDFAPGMPNPDVVIEYRDMSPIEMIQTLGRDYAFTAFEQGDGKILIIPAVEKEPSSKPAEPKNPPTDSGIPKPKGPEGEKPPVDAKKPSDTNKPSDSGILIEPSKGSGKG